MTNLNKKMMNTPDLNAERFQKLKELFPDLFTLEGKLNPDELKKIIDPNLVKETERFEFKWFGKSNAKRTAFTPSKATLVYDEKRSVNTDDADGNMIIEGENLETLKCLLSAYREKVKCIYIDPPYNTGKDFVYSDKWNTDKESYWEHIGVTDGGIKIDSNVETMGRYHSNWLNMMYSRLLLARQLLKEDGVMFISIDDNELNHLIKIGDEIFGEENRIGIITVVSNLKGRSDDKYYATAHNYLLVYKKLNFENLGVPIPDEYLEDYKEVDESGKRFRLLGLRKRGAGAKREDRPNMFFSLFANPKNGKVSFKKTDIYTEEIIPKLSDGSDGRWRWGKDTVVNRIDELFSRPVGSNNRFDVFQIDYAEFENGLKRIKPKTIWTGSEFSNEAGTLEIRELFKAKIFDSPKPIGLLKFCFEHSTNDNDLILDFFAGSGTTAHAVIDLNKEDNGNRKYILVQLPEFVDETSEAYKAGYKKISDITIERNKRLIERIEQEEKEKEPELFDKDKQPYKPGFKVFRLEKSNFPRVDFTPDPEKTDEENVVVLKTYIVEKEDMFLSVTDDGRIFDEVLLKNGFMLNYKKEQVEGFTENKVFRINDEYKECLICMDMGIDDKTIAGLEGYKDSVFICLERALDTTKKWNLKHLLGEKLVAF